MTGNVTVPRWAWIVIAVVVASAFYLTAISNGVYATTSPQHIAVRVFGTGAAAQVGRPLGISLHIVLRKIYSVVAFAIVVFAADKALGPAPHRVRRAVILGALYSAAIEVVQQVVAAPESLLVHAFDVLCGALGGWLALQFDGARTAVQKMRRTS